MVSLLISALGRLISELEPRAVYEALEQAGYLSKSALAEADGVVSAVQKVQGSWPSRPADGAEMWRSIQATLEGEGFLSAAGRAAARRYVSRW